MMSGMTERDNAIIDSFQGFIGFIAWPFVRSSWRKMIRDHKEEHVFVILMTMILADADTQCRNAPNLSSLVN